jgi:hypothetical protein
VKSLQKGERPRDYVRRVLLNQTWSHPSDRLIFLVVVLLDVGDRFWIRIHRPIRAPGYLLPATVARGKATLVGRERVPGRVDWPYQEQVQ